MCGSSGNHVGLSVLESSSGDFYFTEGFSVAGSQRLDLVLSKLNPVGTLLWSRIYRSPGASLMASITAAGPNLILSGNITASGGTNSRGVVVGLDDDGNILWRKKVKPDTRSVFLGKPVVSSDGSILVSGCAGNRNGNNMDSILVKTNSNGRIQGGCSKLTNFGLSNAEFNLNSSAIVLDEIPVPFFTSTAGFQVMTFSASESFVCFSGD